MMNASSTLSDVSQGRGRAAATKNTGHAPAAAMSEYVRPGKGLSVPPLILWVPYFGPCFFSEPQAGVWEIASPYLVFGCKRWCA